MYAPASARRWKADPQILARLASSVEQAVGDRPEVLAVYLFGSYAIASEVAPPPEAAPV